MSVQREKFSTQMDTQVLADLRHIAKTEGRQLQSLIEEAVKGLVAERKAMRPDAELVTKAQSIMDKYSDALEISSKKRPHFGKAFHKTILSLTGISGPLLLQLSHFSPSIISRLQQAEKRRWTLSKIAMKMQKPIMKSSTLGSAKIRKQSYDRPCSCYRRVRFYR